MSYKLILTREISQPEQLERIDIAEGLLQGLGCTLVSF